MTEVETDRVVLNVGGKMFHTTRSTLLSLPNTLLSRMFAPENKQLLRPDKDGSFFFDRDGDIFPYILNIYRTNSVIKPVLVDLRERFEAEIGFWNVYDPKEWHKEKQIQFLKDESVKLLLSKESRFDVERETNFDKFSPDITAFLSNNTTNTSENSTSGAKKIRSLMVDVIFARSAADTIHKFFTKFCDSCVVMYATNEGISFSKSGVMGEYTSLHLSCEKLSRFIIENVRPVTFNMDVSSCNIDLSHSFWRMRFMSDGTLFSEVIDTKTIKEREDKPAKIFEISYNATSFQQNAIQRPFLDEKVITKQKDWNERYYFNADEILKELRNFSFRARFDSEVFLSIRQNELILQFGPKITKIRLVQRNMIKGSDLQQDEEEKQAEEDKVEKGKEEDDEADDEDAEKEEKEEEIEWREEEEGEEEEKVSPKKRKTNIAPKVCLSRRKLLEYLRFLRTFGKYVDIQIASDESLSLKVLWHEKGNKQACGNVEIVLVNRFD